MKSWKNLSDVRREYGHDHVRIEKEGKLSPIEHFKCWFEEIRATEIVDPNAMVLSTVDKKGYPDARVVLLKGLEEGAFIFYTNYQSTKGHELQHQPYAALTFYWPQMSRQVRIRGRVKKVSAAQSDIYFASRPLGSQLSAILSPQSQEIESICHLADKLKNLMKGLNIKIKRPRHWGGYQVIPDEIEFWQGHNDRLHERIHYFRQKKAWKIRYLAP